MKARDWVAIVVSIVALGISATTAYFSVIRQSEEMRVYIGRTPPILSRMADSSLEIEGSLDIAFVNTGTRPIVVQLVGLDIADVSERREIVPAVQSGEERFRSTSTRSLSKRKIQ